MEVNTAIEVKDLRKVFTVSISSKGFFGKLGALFRRRYRIITAVNKINFTVCRGEFVGYVGENGAGKSTTIKMLTGILMPTSGIAVVNGIVPYENRKKNAFKIGVVFGQRTQLWWDLPVRESFDLLRIIYRIPKSNYDHQMRKLEKALDLRPLLDMPVRKLSLGQRMRCDLAASLIHNPPVLFLDEPTIGLDVLAKDSIRSFLAETNREEGTAIILTTHDMNDIEQLCKRLIILDEGRIVFDGETAVLKQNFIHEKEIEVEFHDSNYVIDKIPGMTIVHEEGCKKWLTLNNNSAIGDIISTLVTKYKIKDISVKEPSVENIIRNIYNDRIALPKFSNKSFVE